MVSKWFYVVSFLILVKIISALEFKEISAVAIIGRYAGILCVGTIIDQLPNNDLKVENVKGCLNDWKDQPYDIGVRIGKMVFTSNKIDLINSTTAILTVKLNFAVNFLKSSPRGNLIAEIFSTTGIERIPVKLAEKHKCEDEITIADYCVSPLDNSETRSLDGGLLISEISEGRHLLGIVSTTFLNGKFYGVMKDFEFY